jgi:hypothetical protein
MAGIMVAAAAVAAGSALAKGISGAVQASKAKKALNNFKRQELKNVTEGMRVSTLGAELQTQEAQRRFSTSVDALRSGGVRGLVGGLGTQEQLQQVQQQRVSADLDRQQVAIEQMRAQDEGRIRGMQEERETFDIGRLAGQQAAGRAQVSSAIGDIGNIATSFISPAGKATPKNNTTLMSQTGLKAQQGALGSAQFATERGGFLGLGKEQSVFKGFEGIKPIVPNYTIKPI